jgi:hypothetical protein
MLTNLRDALLGPDSPEFVLLRLSALFTAHRSAPMLFKLFRKPAESRPAPEQDPALAEELARRVNAIQFRPSKGFLKDQQQPKRSSFRNPGHA